MAVCAIPFNFFMEVFSLLGLLFVVVRLRPCLVLDGQAWQHLSFLFRCVVLQLCLLLPQFLQLWV